MLDYLVTAIIVLVGLRTILWHLQCWQLREYRFDRLRAYFQTRDGWKNMGNLWFFRGILPRPTLSGRVILILLLVGIISAVEYWAFAQYPWPLWGLAIIWERTLWITISLAVWISKFPVWLAERRLYAQAKKIVENSSVTRIGITGSYGKSSTKQILVHLLQSGFGEKNVLYNPENQNNEIAIARLILKNKDFFTDAKDKYFVCEIGAYRMGEIRKVCRFVQPHIGILTGINAQHISLFGSQENIQKGKFELAESASNKVFFNADNQFLSQIFADRDIKAAKIPLSINSIKNIQSKIDRTEFEIYGEKTYLPWSGEFFVGNALLAAETARELGLKQNLIATYLQKLPSLKRALTTEKMKSGALLIKDLYSANPDGVLRAIDHLSKTKGKRIFVSIPLLELGEKAKETHQKIFEKLRDSQAEIFWMKEDYALLGKKICGEKFHGSNVQKLQEMLQTLRSDDAILLESRLPENILKLFS